MGSGAPLCSPCVHLVFPLCPPCVPIDSPPCDPRLGKNDVDLDSWGILGMAEMTGMAGILGGAGDDWAGLDGGWEGLGMDGRWGGDDKGHACSGTLLHPPLRSQACLDQHALAAAALRLQRAWRASRARLRLCFRCSFAAAAQRRSGLRGRCPGARRCPGRPWPPPPHWAAMQFVRPAAHRPLLHLPHMPRRAGQRAALARLVPARTVVRPGGGVGLGPRPVRRRRLAVPPGRRLLLHPLRPHVRQP